ncbi:MAG: response regulator [Candidatus Methylomirabilis oxygeniifera]|uniref:Putative response regulator receiver (CheY-like protein) n=1 Tax=Methylomirabilis oxygeniifera TaxID=671143 RepID=D5MGD9_METO1|nr:MAG: response regulator [Candidatus Methylomirabilis oxyfera]CBE68820.1 putative response regulator receiver (CheY-like protein) [Candidatus Methylomirabilis oxyfera]
MRVLIVDDSATMRRIIRNNLKFAGHDDAVEAGNGVEGLACLTGNQIDLVITDWNMPEMNGIEFVKAIRSNDQLKQLPVLMITTVAERENIMVALSAGVSNYIVKPFDAETLKKKLEQILATA